MSEDFLTRHQIFFDKLEQLLQGMGFQDKKVTKAYANFD